MKFKMKNKSLLDKEEIDLENHSKKTTTPCTSKSKLRTNNFLTRSKTNLNYQSNECVNNNSIKSNSNKNDKTNKETNQDLVLVNNEDMHKFYTTRLKHSLIIRFLLLVPIQNLSLCLISQFSENVS